ncbi:tRNA (N6-isopentenyl adenosine(37)-C2)-methylthiotransferase MiaB [Desulfovibrio desulfuricans]|uniref:tRNA-2-methylthio-N(6)-dimethylallyladenosine synthase n=1 Tax=Desulfovibrio desulfuricans TaxID=876 RepID=A0A4P7UMV0_DESDE|nr:tRNA (N6-isopentenyl adenosine(37)-C2)-methylthiotransferase MiaB [Desulfovibrio desulfuricans]QCC86194.1 tRNA (N6-isopentenyl adenosine(37)-C2)-methylthiotransferase MiaB [Desulfovibrio desulfuricans]
MIEKTYHIITFGCQMNVHDSHWLGRALSARGFFEAPLEDAQVVVVNTCSVREKPEQKVMSALGRIRQLSGGNPAVLVCVAGCVAQQLGESLFEKESQVRLVAGSDGIGNAPQAIERLLENPAQRLSLLDFTSQYVEREATTEPGVVNGAVAYANIMQGCDNFCAYCIVPFTRGRQKSRGSAAIIDECKALLDNGAREITLLGQNVNAFGQDKSGDGTSFAALLRKVAALPGLERLRYVTPHPKDMGPEDIAAFAELPQLCPRLHLPMQAGSDAVLARMKRRYDSAAFLDLVERLRKARPDLALSTDLIVGFPGESEQDFQDTLRMMRASNFMSSFSFCYSDRPGTRASLFLDKIPAEVAQDRLLRLQALQDELGANWLRHRVGDETTLLIENPSPKESQGPEPSWQGRDPYGAPVHVELPPLADHTGRMVRVRISQAKKHSLMAQRLGEPW